jgi:penicillin-binding protein 1A
MAMERFESTQQGAADTPVGEPPPTRRGLIARLPWELRLAILAPLCLGLPALLLLFSAFVYYTVVFPNPLALRQKQRAPVIRILARDGSVMSERGGADTHVPIEQLPHHLIDAVVATEDRRFFEHWGIDTTSLLRAAYANLRAGRFVQGGSTLTQQLAKNLFLTSQRTLDRKLEELILALWLEVRLSKPDILELYLNRVYFGGGAYGVEAAAQHFFGKAAAKATLAEAAVLAGLLKAPSKFSPAANPEIAWSRARSVMAKMAEAGLLSSEAEDTAARGGIRFADGLQQREQMGLDYAVDAVLERLPPLAGSEMGELIVETTIDGALQRKAQAIVHDRISEEGRAVGANQAGLVLIDMDGGIRALVGGRSYAESQFNRALKAKRQPGSAFKTFVYLAALESGMKPDSIIQDLPILGAGWSPRNENGRYRGAITLRDGLTFSMNAAAARLNMTVGPHNTAALAHRLGITSPLREEASLALGTSEVTLVELSGAYGVLANAGRSLQPHIVVEVRTAAGQELYRRPPESRKMLLAPAHVGAINDMLNSVVVFGTGRRAALPGHPAAGKTGTSQDFRDAWFVGFTAHFVAGVWVGNDDGRAMNKVMGGSLPARLWREVMTLAHEGHAPRPLPGTMPAAPPVARHAAAAPIKTHNLSLQPREPIEPDVIARALNGDGGVDPRPSAAPAAPQPRQTWAGAKLGAIKRSFGLGT